MRCLPTQEIYAIELAILLCALGEKHSRTEDLPAELRIAGILPDELLDLLIAILDSGFQRGPEIRIQGIEDESPIHILRIAQEIGSLPENRFSFTTKEICPSQE